MVTVVFWNIAKKPAVLPHLACLARAHDIDVFLIAECPRDVSSALTALNGLSIGHYVESYSGEGKVRALTRLSTGRFFHRFTGLASDLTVWSLETLGTVPGDEVLLAAVHLSSKMGGFNDEDQATASREVVEELNQAEDRLGHRNTALVGDFNMNPYDAGMTSAACFHGQMTRGLAGKPDRVYREQPRRRFYNPMWGLFGDRSEGPPGSYYFGSSVPHNHYWQLFDQLLLRKELMDHLTELRILTMDGIHSLIDTEGIPDRDQFSDHLPILFRLDV